MMCRRYSATPPKWTAMDRLIDVIMKSILFSVTPLYSTDLAQISSNPLQEANRANRSINWTRKESRKKGLNYQPNRHTMRPTLLLRAGHYTPKIQFMGSKWKEAKSTSISYCVSIPIPFPSGLEKMGQGH
jgi:hypothetical protein